MFIHCPKEFREINDSICYTNRAVNLSTVSVIGKAMVDRNEIYSFYTIRFSHNKTHSTEWYFVNKKDRDKVYENIEKKWVDIVEITADPPVEK